jgi:uncharacterized protein YukE
MTTATSGMGIVDSYAGLVDSITSDAESEGEKVVDVALSATGVVVDTIGAAVDPFGAIVSAGVGWLLEHVSFLREPLDALLGNPDAINANTDRIKTMAAEMHTIAEEHRQDLQAMAGWQGQAAEATRASLSQMADEIESLGKTLDGTAAVVGISGMLVVTLRGIIFDIISSLITELIRYALIAAASAACTFGASIASFLGVASVRATATATRISGKLTNLMSSLTRQTGRLGQLAKSMENLADGMDRFVMAGDIAFGAYQAAKPYPTQA